MIKAIEEFETIINKYKKCWNQIHIKVLCAKVNHKYVNLITIISLESVKIPQNKLERKMEFSQTLVAIDATLKITRLKTLLNMLIKEKMKIEGYTILIGKSEDLGLKWPIYFMCKKILLRQEYYLRQNPFTNFVLESSLRISNI